MFSFAHKPFESGIERFDFEVVDAIRTHEGDNEFLEVEYTRSDIDHPRLWFRIPVKSTCEVLNGKGLQSLHELQIAVGGGEYADDPKGLKGGEATAIFHKDGRMSFVPRQLSSSPF